MNNNSNEFKRLKVHTSLKYVQKKKGTKSLTKVIIILQRKTHFFNLIWSLEVLLAGLFASKVVVPSLSLEAPSAGMTFEAKSYWKPWEATPTSRTTAALSEGTSWEASVSFVGPYWLVRGGPWGCTSLFGSVTVEATSSWAEGRSEAHIAEG